MHKATVNKTEVIMSDSELSSWLRAQIEAYEYVMLNQQRKQSVLYSFEWMLGAYLFGVLIGVFAG